MSENTSNPTNAIAIKAAIAQVFAANQFKQIDPPVIQPADPFLDLSGEDIRRRIYVFTDPYGHELCLRPDLTIPACLHYLADAADKASVRRYAYEGLAFRCQEPKADKPNEFSQSGIELIGEVAGPQADATVFALTMEACKAAGLKEPSVTLGDLGLFAAFIEALDIPPHWQGRLRRNFWQPAHFGALLSKLSQQIDAAVGGGVGVAAVLAKQSDEEARQTVAGLLDLASLDHVPGRSIESVTRRLQEKARDGAADPVSLETVEAIRAYLQISGSPGDAIKAIADLANKTQIDLTDALTLASDRLSKIATHCPADVTFATEFGRRFDYYTGFVFEITAGGQQIAGGGRYDDLLLRLGADARVPAVGAMIRTDRLESVLAAGLERPRAPSPEPKAKDPRETSP